MTKEEAMEIITNALQSDESKYTEKIDKALALAQKALAQEPCEDAVSRQAVLNALRDAENHAFNAFYNGPIKAHKIVANLPPVTPQPKTGNWIPVSERLPKESGEYLAWIKPYDESPYMSIEEIDCDGVIKEWNHIRPSEIIAWMPLPKPYLAESEE